MKVVIILPTYNEKGNIGILIDNIEKVIGQLRTFAFDILVVDDSSPDGTALIVQEKQKKYPNLHLLVNKEKIGLGRAIIFGMDYAAKNLGGEILMEMDADLSHDPKKIPEFLAKIEEGSDFVVGSRYIKGGAVPRRWALHRKIFSRVGNLIVRIILGIFWVHEWTNGFRAVKRKFFETARNELLDFSGYTFQVAFLHKSIKNGAKVAEIPIVFSERYYGRSKMAPLEYITSLLVYLVTARISELWDSGFLKFCVVGTIGFIVNAVGLELFYQLGLKPGPAAVLGTEMAIISNFALNNLWTFSANKIRNFFQLIPKFIQFNFTSAGAIFIQGVVVGIGTFFLGDQTRLLFLTISVVFFVLPYNWLIYTRLIWKTHAK